MALGDRDQSRLDALMDRRDFVGTLTLGLAIALVGCSPARSHASPTSAPGTPSPSSGGPNSASGAAMEAPTTIRAVDAAPGVSAVEGSVSVAPWPIPSPHPGKPRVISHGPAALNQIALTVDDGTSEETVAGYVAFVQRTGIHLTFCPNGSNGTWTRHADALRPLVEAGQIQVANHTWSHPDLRQLSDAKVRAEIERNERWIQKTFGLTARPWFRPPFGYRDSRIDSIAGSLGYTKVLTWNGTYGDSGTIAPEVLLGLAEQWMKAGTIMLGHANHPTVLGLFDQLQGIMASRDLHPVTLDEMFSTSRRTG